MPSASVSPVFCITIAAFTLNLALLSTLTSRATTGEELESDRLKARLGAALIERDLLHEKIALLEVDRPFARRRRKP